MNEKFEYTYAAPTKAERKEAEEIRKRYLPTDNAKDKLQRLKELDKKAKQPAIITSLSLGIVGTLIFGLGLALTLEFGKMEWGVLISAIGLIPVGLAYPAYLRLFARGKKKYGKEILKLSEDILKEKEE
ncbi:MAG: dihydropteridine reductase [Clostridia bacterium]|nr:dihydropteridine reductase [Clostridia bacterium]